MIHLYRYCFVLALVLVLGVGIVSAGDLARVDFRDESIHAATGGIFGEPILFSGLENPDEDPFDCDNDGFDLLDIEDDNRVCTPDPQIQGISQSDISGGGRWMLSLVSGENPTPVHAVGVNFSDIDTSTDDADCSALANLTLGEELGGAPCSCGSICFVQVRVIADRVFKRGATRQALSISVLKQDEAGTWPPRLDIDYIDPLYICPGVDTSERWLQSTSCDGNQQVSEAELSQVLSNQRSSIGRWNLPLRLRLQRSPRTGSGSDDGGSGGGCTLKAKGDSCATGAECCSGNCSGRAGRKTCK
jgi:hypothetical protein